MSKTILVTGAAGFIGSNFVEIALQKGYSVVGYDALTYAGHLENLETFQTHPQFHFVKGDILDTGLFSKTLNEHKITWIAHFAAESHVDKSISGPKAFIETNVNGTYSLLTAAREYFEKLNGQAKDDFRFLHVSTDEVFGTLGATGKFTETTPYQPNSPYSASKASSDLLVRAWFHTYGLPTIITNCSNNYGAKQFPEKLIPHMVFCALQGKPLPVYGKGDNIRDWIQAKDHAGGVLLALEKGKVGETYCFGGNSERTNLEVVKAICKILNEIVPREDQKSYEALIQFVTDRPGHDFRYAIDDQKAQKELGFTRQFLSFEAGLKEAVNWYLANLDWSQKVTAKEGVKVTYDWAELSRENTHMKILLLGAQGQVGQAFQNLAKTDAFPIGWELIAWSRTEGDLTKIDALVQKIKKLKPDAIVNAAAYTAVDLAEKETELAEEINAKAPTHFAAYAKSAGIPLIHFSTDYVYEGAGHHAHDEREALKPVNAYGKSKAHGDQAIQSSGCDYLIFRTSWIFSSIGKNFVKTMLKLSATNTEIKVVKDQVGSPTLAKDLAMYTLHAFMRAIEHKSSGRSFPSGVYHLCNSGTTTWAEFAKAILPKTKIIGISTREYPTAAVRPENSRLNLDKFEQTFGVRPRLWTEALQECLVSLGVKHAE